MLPVQRRIIRPATPVGYLPVNRPGRRYNRFSKLTQDKIEKTYLYYLLKYAQSNPLPIQTIENYFNIVSFHRETGLTNSEALETRDITSPQMSPNLRTLPMTYTVNISLPGTTASTLASGGYNLIGYKGVNTNSTNAAPLVWFVYPAAQLAPNLTLTWSESYSAFVSANTQLSQNTQITAANSISASLGQDVVVAAGAAMTAQAGMQTNGIQITNNSTAVWNCGISQLSPTGTMTQLCALPLLTGNTDTIVPVEKIFLAFSTAPVNTGTVIYTMSSAGAVMDLTFNQSVSATYNGSAWTANDGGSWLTPVASNQSFAGLINGSIG